MDITEKATQIATSLSKFEDSPVFNYINSLSPFKPVKSIPITQTFNSLNFSSLPSIFTSPHVIAHRETRFLKRNNCSDPSKAGSSSENGNKVFTDDGVAMDASQLYDNSAQLQENFDTGVSIEEDSVEPSSNSKFVIELLRALKYDCSSPGWSSTPCSVIETNSVSEKARTSDAQDLLIFNYQNESEAFKGLIQKSMDPGERFCTSLVTQFLQNDLSGEPTIQIVDSVGSGQQNEDAQSAQPGESSELKEVNETEDNLANDDLNNCLTGNPSESVGDEVGVCVQDACKRVPTLHRGMLRRSLDFEQVAWRKNLNDSSNCSSIILQSNEKIASQLVPLMPTSDSPRCILLNALTLASQDNKNFTLEIFSRQLSLPTSTASIHSPESGQEPVQESLTSAAAERDMVPVDDGVPLPEDASQTSSYLVGEESNLNGPKKKRRRMELAGESESVHKRCNCKKSKCLKLYCECFAAGVYCIEPCSCQDCFNKPIHEDTVLATRKQIKSRNLLAFAPKVIRNSDSVPEHGDESSKTPASARHKRGCNCKKSSCLKKYCECYQGGVGCSINCRCEGCKNTFGRKDGCFFTSSGGLRSFEHPLNELKPVPRVDSSGQVCGSTFKVDAGTKKLAACQASGVLQTGLSSTKLRTVLFC